jgi:sec-independent protein translocase protein TatB
MLDIGWPELAIIALITILVVGPKEIPRVLRTVTQFVRKLRAMASEFQSGIDELAREAELDDLKNSIEKTASKDLASDLENTVDPTGEVAGSVREIEASVKEDPSKSKKEQSSGKEDAASAIRSAAPSSSEAEDEASAPAPKSGEGG